MPTLKELTSLSRAIHNAIGDHWKDIEFDGLRLDGDTLIVNIRRTRALRHPDEYGGKHAATAANQEVERLIEEFVSKHNLKY